MNFTLDQFRVDEKVAIVTGAGGRGNSIGRAYALGLASAGASIVVADLNGDGAKAIADEIVAGGGKAVGVQVDVADEASTLAMGKAASEAIRRDRHPDQQRRFDGRRQLRQCRDGLDRRRGTRRSRSTPPVPCCAARAVIPLDADTRRREDRQPDFGRRISSQRTHGITKIALVGLTTSLAKQFGKDGITCNAIAPGNVRSDAGKMLVPDDSRFSQFLKMTCAIHPRGEPEELVGAVVLLCSEAGSGSPGRCCTSMAAG